MLFLNICVWFKDYNNWYYCIRGGYQFSYILTPWIISLSSKSVISLILWCHYQGKRLGLRLRQLKPTRCYPMIWNICNSCFAITKHIIQKISGLCSESYLFSTNCKLSINYQYNYKKICCFHLCTCRMASFWSNRTNIWKKANKISGFI